MRDWADFLRAIASLLWASLGFVFVFIFRSQIKELFNRFRKGKFLGQEIELEARREESVLPSSAVKEQFTSILSSPEFQAKLSTLVVAPPGGDHGSAIERVTNVFRSAADESVKSAFITIDSTPLLEARGDIWEEPYDKSLTVHAFLNSVWFHMATYIQP